MTCSPRYSEPACCESLRSPQRRLAIGVDLKSCQSPPACPTTSSIKWMLRSWASATELVTMACFWLCLRKGNDIGPDFWSEPVCSTNFRATKMPAQLRSPPGAKEASTATYRANFSPSPRKAPLHEACRQAVLLIQSKRRALRGTRLLSKPAESKSSTGRMR